jgi:hypothetical protein
MGVVVAHLCRAIRANKDMENSRRAANLQLSNTEVTKSAKIDVIPPPHNSAKDLGPAYSETPFVWQPLEARLSLKKRGT